MAASTALVSIADEACRLGLAAALHSVVQHTRPCPPIYVVDVGLSDESQEKLPAWALHQAADVRFVSAKESRLAEVRHQGLLPSAEGYAASGTWFKLCLPDLLPDGLQRVLCMDCKPLAAVRDVGFPCGPEDLRAAGWTAGRPYFNAGLLLIDLQWLAGAAATSAGIIAQHSAALRYHDQDVLNLLAMASMAGSNDSAPTTSGDSWLELPQQWNAQGVGTYARFRTAEEQSRPALFGSGEELRLYEQRPAVVHFTGPLTVAPPAYLDPFAPSTSKPCAYLCQHPFRDAFFVALDSTPWRGWRPPQADVAEACAADIEALLGRVAAENAGFDACKCRQQIAVLLQAPS